MRAVIIIIIIVIINQDSQSISSSSTSNKGFGIRLVSLAVTVAGVLLSAITFNDITKLYGDHSVGTSCKKCKVRVAFHHERLYEIENLAGECYKPKRTQLHITKDSMGRVSDQCAFNNRKIYR